MTSKILEASLNFLQSYFSSRGFYYNCDLFYDFWREKGRKSLFLRTQYDENLAISSFLFPTLPKILSFTFNRENQWRIE